LNALRGTRAWWTGIRHTKIDPGKVVDKLQGRLKVLTARFRNALKKSVQGIIEAGRVLIEAKNELEHGQFTEWVVRELRFGSVKDGSRPADLRKAQILMFLARNEVISNANHWYAFPPSWRTPLIGDLD
jgi:hypothetical protein